MDSRRLTKPCVSVLECAHNERSRAEIEHGPRIFGV
jgi:hypothetical protein